jgi:hypothetical protein
VGKGWKEWFELGHPEEEEGAGVMVVERVVLGPWGMLEKAVVNGMVSLRGKQVQLIWIEQSGLTVK